MGAKQRDIGIKGELELAVILRSHGWKAARRGVQHSGGPNSPDVAEGPPGIHFERKRVAALQIYRSMAQATMDAGHANIAVVSFRGKGIGKAELAILTLEDFLNLLKKIPAYAPPLEQDFVA